MRRTRRFLIALCGLLTLTTAAFADEGMWLPNALPTELLKERYQFEPTPEWMEHVQRSCIRFGRGGSASFVSPDGLIMTNHHVGADEIQQLSDETHDYLRDGFYAATREQELRCPDVEIYVLQKIEDVTAAVNQAVTPSMSVAAANEARKAATATIEKDAEARTGLHPETVTLYHGARYHLYLYKTYKDVRLVMAPHSDIAFFGGDIRNFEYPRHCLDVAFFRAYENDKPARVEHYLRFSKEGVQDGELVFTAGHPARTRRLYTVDHLAFLRDMELPLILAAYNQREVALHQYMARSDEHRRRAETDLLGVQNGRKAFGGMLDGLLDAGLMQQKHEAERELRSFVAANSDRQSAYASAWDELAAALTAARSYYTEYYLLGNRRMRLSELYVKAVHIVRLADELPKPDADRLEEYRDTNIELLRRQLLSPAPIYADLERVLLDDGLTRMARILGYDHAATRLALAGTSPTQRAGQLVAGTKLFDVEYRRKLLEGGAAAVQSCDDELIELARQLDPHARRLRKRYENELESVTTAAYARIAQATFDKYGESIYPDATSSLRVSFGTVAGYDDAGQAVPPLTHIGGAFADSETHQNQPPFNLPAAWLERKDALDLETPFDFVSTNDIIGGNSGSPAFNRNAETVGLIFDGNIQSLSWDYQFSQTQGRAVSVDVRAIIEALRKVYGAEALAAELLGSDS